VESKPPHTAQLQTTELQTAEAKTSSPPKDNEEILSRIEKTLLTKYWKWVFHSYDDLPDSLFSHVTKALPHIPAEEWVERADFGGLYVNGYQALKEQNLPCPCRIEYYEPKFNLRDASVIFPQITEDNILYRDDDLAIVFKPLRMPSVPAKDQRYYSLKSSIEKILKKKVHMPSRLDVSVQGLVAISLSPRMHPLLQRLFEDRKVSKEYRLLTGHTPPAPLWEVNGSIDRDPTHAVLRRVVSEGGKPSLTKFTTLGSSMSGGGWLVAAQPLTGRTHQIRVHASYSGIPIDGDNFYGGRTSDELLLASYKLNFIHPISSKDFEFELPQNLQSLWMNPDQK
jgi:23S rRNA-/tRNA-specific pseudouridylate synthase